MVEVIEMIKLIEMIKIVGIDEYLMNDSWRKIDQ